MVAFRYDIQPLPGKPLITQGFGQHPEAYAPYGLAGHNGIDFDCDEGTVVYSPHDGIATVTDDGNKGYGLYLVIEESKRRSILAHLSQCDVTTGEFVYQGQPIGKSGKSGNVTGPHLHWTYKILSNGAVQNKDNGFDGAMDVTEFTRLWQDEDLHHDAKYTDEAKEYLTMTFPTNQYLPNPMRHA